MLNGILEAGVAGLGAPELIILVFVIGIIVAVRALFKAAWKARSSSNGPERVICAGCGCNTPRARFCAECGRPL